MVYLKPLILNNVDAMDEYEEVQREVLKHNKVNNTYRPSLPFGVTRKLRQCDRPLRVGKDISQKINCDKSILSNFAELSEVQRYCNGLGLTDLATRGYLLINSGCGSGKTEAGIRIMELVQRRTIIITTRENICKQWIDRISRAHPKLKIGYDVCDVDYDVECCTAQYLLKHQCAFNDVGLILIDEAHTIIGCVYFIPIMKALASDNHPFCLAMTATISFDETKKYTSMKVCGKVSSILTKSSMYSKDVFKNGSFESVFGEPMRFEDKTMKDIKINRVIATFNAECKSIDKVNKYFKCMASVKLNVHDRYGLILTKELAENSTVAVAFADHFGIPVEIIYDITVGCKTIYPGTLPNMIPLIQAHPMIDKTCRIYVCTTSRASTGYDDPRLSWGLTLHDPNSNAVFIQSLGRIKRFTRADDKEKYFFMPEFKYVNLKVKADYKSMDRASVLKGVTNINNDKHLTLYRDKMASVRPKIMDELNVKTVMKL